MFLKLIFYGRLNEIYVWLLFLDFKLNKKQGTDKKRFIYFYS